MNFDPRVTPARSDLAAAHLKGKVEAERFVEGIMQQVLAPTATAFSQPRPDAPMVSEALYGERVTVYETTGEGWAWGQMEADGYIGWFSANAFGPVGKPATHRVTALRTFVFDTPDIKRAPAAALSFASQIAVSGSQGEFVTTDAGFIPAPHVAPLAHREPDFVATARRFLGTPYLWGGRSSTGLDCSGLVQLALAAAGRSCPRDSDMQQAALGERIPFSGDLAALRRGDLLFWKGHVGFVSDAGRFLHANAFHLAAAEEPLAEAVARIKKSGLEILEARRV
ncbi:MAG TPA: NlpC/P60 family protein [Xanthobacteraceae bacterium]|nr:NlpC/P60 family protein [Xanthobacteraceae bacterium]